MVTPGRETIVDCPFWTRLLNRTGGEEEYAEGGCRSVHCAHLPCCQARCSVCTVEYL